MHSLEVLHINYNQRERLFHSHGRNLINSLKRSQLLCSTDSNRLLLLLEASNSRLHLNHHNWESDNRKVGLVGHHQDESPHATQQWQCVRGDVKFGVNQTTIVSNGQKAPFWFHHTKELSSIMASPTCLWANFSQASVWVFFKGNFPVATLPWRFDWWRTNCCCHGYVVSLLSGLSGCENVVIMWS